MLIETSCQLRPSRSKISYLVGGGRARGRGRGSGSGRGRGGGELG